MNTRTKYFERLEDRRLLSLSVELDQMEYLSESLDIDFCQEVGVADESMTARYAWNIPQLNQITDSTTGDMVESISIEGAPLAGAPGQVLLPVIPSILVLPQGMTPAGIDITVGAEQIIPGEHRLVTSANPEALNSSATLAANHRRESGSEATSDLFEFIGVQRCRGVDVLLVNLKPIRYNIETGSLSYYATMDLSVHLESAMGPEAASNLMYRADGIRPLASWVDNPQQLNDYASWPFEKAAGTGADIRQSGICDTKSEYQYVIITSDALANATTDYTLLDLAEYHEAHGLTSTIVTTQTIYDNYSGVDNPEKIRNFIIDAYNNWETDFILLGGDTNIIPYRELYSPLEGGTSIPSDLYFQCLDGSYNEDGDLLWGENTDGPGGTDVDLLAEVYIGRASAENPSEMANWVYKNLTYANQPVSQNRLHAAMVGEHLGFGGVANFAKPALEEIRLGTSNNSYTTSGFASDLRFATSTLYDADSIWSAAQLIAMMNTDTYGVFNHLGHSDTNYVMKLYNSDVDALTNADYFFVYSQGCLSGNFPGDAIAEHFISSTRTGAFAGVFNSRYGWGGDYSTDGSSQRTNREFWDAYFHENITQLGPMNADSHEDVLWDISNDYIRWVVYDTNLFGDPAIDIGVEIDGIDLTGTRLEINPENMIDANGTTEAAFSLYNSGNIDAGSFDLTFYLSEDENIDPKSAGDILLQIDPSDPNYNPEHPELYHVNGLSASSQWHNAILISVPLNDPFRAGNKYYIGMVVDANDEVVEVLETNNVGRGIGMDFAAVNYNTNIYFADMSTNPNWTLERDWAWGIPTGNEGDPTQGHTGNGVIGYNLNGAYSNDLSVTYATTPVIDCSGYAAITLSFYRWLRIESSSYDHASIEASRNNVDWITVWDHSSGSIIDTNWIYQEIDISEVADDQPTVYIRWQMGSTDSSVNYCGWNIDDVLLTGTVLGPDSVGPAVIGHTPGSTLDAQSVIMFQFNESMDTGSFSVVDDVISFTGPAGDLMSQISGFNWLDPRMLEVHFIEQSSVGTYTMVIGPNIADDGPSNNLMNQDGDAINGEIPHDRYTAVFEIIPDVMGPDVICHTPDVSIDAQSAVAFQFNEPMDTESFVAADDVVHFMGPSGDLMPYLTGFTWLDASTLEVQFSEQTIPGTYTMTIGPNITDDGPSFNVMDQDDDTVPGEIPDDRYTATFEIIDAIYFADMSSNPNWTLETDWNWGIPTGNSGDPTSGYTGSHVMGYNLNGDYQNDLPATYATTPAIDCSGYTEITLSFYRWLGIESSEYDHAGVEISNNNMDWTTVWEHSSSSSTDTEWTYKEYDIAAVADEQPAVYIRWKMGSTDDSVTYCGWNIDDILITGRLIAEDGDFNSDGVCDTSDLDIWSDGFGQFPNGGATRADGDGDYDGDVDGNDFLVWQLGCGNNETSSSVGSAMHTLAASKATGPSSDRRRRIASHARQEDGAIPNKLLTRQHLFEDIWDQWGR